jgi:hypothetical protein
MTNPRVNPYFLFDHEGGIVNVPYTQYRQHEGGYFAAAFTWTALADNGTGELLIIPPTAHHIHLSWGVTVGGDSLGFLYEGVGVTGKSGTAVNAHSTNRNISNPPHTKVFHGPEGISATGEPLYLSSFLPGGIGPRTVGGQANVDARWGLSAGGAYLMRIANHGGGSKTAMISLGWYEDEQP